MTNSVRGTSFRSARVLIAVALASMMLVGGSAALAGGSKTGGTAASASGDRKPVFVSGNSTASDCGLPGSDWAISLTGDLEGCWSSYIQRSRCKELQDYALYFEEGHEVFVGKFRGKHGRFQTTYTLEAAYTKGLCQSLDFTTEVGGTCTHRVIGGRGVFADAKGLIKFIDVITGVTGDPVTGEFQAGTGGNNFLYHGRIAFDRDDTVSRSSRTASSATARQGAGSSSATSSPSRTGGGC